ncbi:serpin family protein [Phytoactinopolyspora limicola]|uniref:serpin family protein n=1 Tax=Phytoactinopolyspora limicola TaxID=2715536 RepID=UPI00140A6472|nr:serpin family protein [Phytoactinopolyspora limicola]
MQHAKIVNALTASWARHVDGGTVLSGAGAWPLLAILAAAADEPGRDELAAAVGLPAGDCTTAARETLTLMAETDGVDAALGVWAHARAHLNPEWAAELPPAAVGELSGDPAADRARLDSWAQEHTAGLIQRFPIDLDPDLMLTLATAVALRTTWTRPFTDEPMRPLDGPWRGQQVAGLKRTTRALDDLRAALTPAGVLTMTRIEGGNGLDVHLVLGEEGRPPGEVLPAAFGLLAGEHRVQHGSELIDADVGPAPGVSVIAAQRPSLALTTTRFTVRSEHDLLRLPAVFGLRTVSRGDRGHFSRISSVPLRVGQARQSAVAYFSAQGFEAAATTAVGLHLVSMPVFKARGLQVTYDRPFGFLAVHRASGLVLFAGWVDEAELA